MPRWYSGQFSDVCDIFYNAFKQAPSNVHMLPNYPTEIGMFELDGRHFKSFVGKDYLDHLLNHCESGMVAVGLDVEVRAGLHENRLTVVENRVDLTRTDLVSTNQRLNVVVARAAEEADSVVNER